MSLFDGESSPAAPFSGDQTGDVFDAPEVVLESPITTERLVDTQSGFVVVVNSFESRRQLSVRRRLGTPPTSQILLTSDESLKLAKILADVPLMDGLQNQALGKPGDAKYSSETEDLRKGLNYFPSAMGLSPGRKANLVVVIAALWAVLLLGAVIGFAIDHYQRPPEKAVLEADKTPILSDTKIDSFLRHYVSDMLDFNPSTYKVSQIRAMAAMSPELVEKYAKDTNFPLNKAKLKALPQGTTVMITKIVQKNLGNDSVLADIYGQMITANSKIGLPVHLRLTLSLDQNQVLRVVEQKDITAINEYSQE